MATRETDTMDTFVDSSWYFLRYINPMDTNDIINKNLASQWLPVDFYLGGIEHGMMIVIIMKCIYLFFQFSCSSFIIFKVYNAFSI